MHALRLRSHALFTQVHVPPCLCVQKKPIDEDDVWLLGGKKGGKGKGKAKKGERACDASKTFVVPSVLADCRVHWRLRALALVQPSGPSCRLPRTPPHPALHAPPLSVLRTRPVPSICPRNAPLFALCLHRRRSPPWRSRTQSCAPPHLMIHQTRPSRPPHTLPFCLQRKRSPPWRS